MSTAQAIVKIFKTKGELEASMKGHTLRENQSMLDTWTRLDHLEEVFFGQEGDLAPHQVAALEDLLEH